MNTLKSAIVAAMIVFAGPALAGGPTSVFFPDLFFPPLDATVTQGSAKVLEQPAHTCTQLELGAGVHPNACGSLTTPELASRKLVGDQ